MEPRKRRRFPTFGISALLPADQSALMASSSLAGYRGAMRTLETTPRNRRGDAQVGTVVHALFRRWPGLLGFAVQEEGELYLTEVALHPWFDEAQRSSLCSEIAVAL